MAKAKKLYTIYGKHSNIIGYEYRGEKYEVEYPVNSTYCCTSPKIQHADNQKRIDKELDTPTNNKAEAKDLDEVMRELYKMWEN